MWSCNIKMLSKGMCWKVVRSMKEILQTVIIAFKSEKKSSQTNKLELLWLLHLKVCSYNKEIVTARKISKRRKDGCNWKSREHTFSCFQEVARSWGEFNFILVFFILPGIKCVIWAFQPFNSAVILSLFLDYHKTKT